MTRKPTEWNVVVPGRWNPGILTPSGIATRIFKLPPGTPVEIQVLVDDYQPFLVRNGPIIVKCGSRMLQVNTDEYSEQSLKAAMEAVCRALEDLPQTPVLAAGINLKYDILEPELSILKGLKSGFDEAASDLGFRIDGRSVRLTFSDPPGVINLDLAKDDTRSDSVLNLAFNFHFASTKQTELLEWLRQPATKVLGKVEELLVGVLKIPS